MVICIVTQYREFRFLSLLSWKSFIFVKLVSLLLFGCYFHGIQDVATFSGHDLCTVRFFLVLCKGTSL